MEVACPSCGQRYHTETAHGQWSCSCGTVFRSIVTDQAEPTPPPAPADLRGPSALWGNPLVTWIATGSIVALCLMAVVVAAITRPRQRPLPVTLPPYVVPPAEMPNLSAHHEPQQAGRAETGVEFGARLAKVEKTTPRMIADEVATNVIAAEKKYRGKLLFLSGEVLTIAKNKDGLPLIVLRTDSAYLLRVFLGDEDIGDVASIRRGDIVFVLTEFAGVGGQVIDLGPAVVCDDDLQVVVKAAIKKRAADEGAAGK